MDNWGDNTNKSSFFISLDEAEFMDDMHVVFGKVIRGGTVLDLLEDEPTHAAASDDDHAEPTVPNNDIIISRCVLSQTPDNVFETLEEVSDEEVIDFQYKDEL